jgi:hypothetical protein
MKLLGCIFFLVGVCSVGVQAQEVSGNRTSDLYFKRSPIEETGENAFNEPLSFKPTLSPIIPLSEVLFQNIFVWWWDRYVIDKNYAKINLHIWKRNFKEGWTWDDNHFAINFFGHPVQGMFYYQAARSTGYGFYSSFFYTLIGSYTWEMFAEREYPSANDLITTSVGGSIYGEVFFRLSQRLLANPDHNYWDEGGAFISSPLGYLQRKSLGARAHNPGYAPLDLSIRTGGGIRFGNEYRYDEESNDRSDGDWNQESGFVGFNLVYGRPNKIVKEPFDYFTVDFTQDYGSDGMLFHLDATGKLKNYNMNSGRNYMDVGSYLHFETFYGDLVEMSANSIGLGADMNIWLNNNIRFRLINMPSFVLLGSSDFNYDDILAAKDSSYEKTRSYQLSTGANYKMSLELEYKGIGQIKNATSVFLFKTMPGSEPHYGAYGYDLVGFNSTNLEGFLPWGYTLGLRFESYLKAAAYEGDDFEPMYRLMYSIGIYVKYIL